MAFQFIAQFKLPLKLVNSDELVFGFAADRSWWDLQLKTF